MTKNTNLRDLKCKMEAGVYRSFVDDDMDIENVSIKIVYPELHSSLVEYYVFGMMYIIHDMYHMLVYNEIMEFVNMLHTHRSGISPFMRYLLKDYVERLDRFGSRELNADFSEFILKYMPVKQVTLAWKIGTLYLSNMIKSWNL
ncbi:hypothetical protein Tco_1288152 [Tanacetum coccineum]